MRAAETSILTLLFIVVGVLGADRTGQVDMDRMAATIFGAATSVSEAAAGAVPEVPAVPGVPTPAPFDTSALPPPPPPPPNYGASGAGRSEGTGRTARADGTTPARGDEAGRVDTPLPPTVAPDLRADASSETPIQPTAVPPRAPSPGEHTVSSGEWLNAIADAYGVSWQALAAANGLTAPYTIYSGQKLIVPTSSENGQSGGQIKLAPTDSKPGAVTSYIEWDEDSITTYDQSWTGNQSNAETYYRSARTPGWGDTDGPPQAQPTAVPPTAVPPTASGCIDGKMWINGENTNLYCSGRTSGWGD